MADERIEFRGVSRRLKYKHRDLRDAVKESGKPVEQMLGDPFDGWPHLLRAGLRWQDTKFTLDNASDLIDEWKDAHSDDPGGALSGLGELIIDALETAKFIKIQRPEGNARPEPTTA